MVTTPEVLGKNPDFYTEQCAALRDMQSRHSVQMLESGLIGRAILAASNRTRERMAQTDTGWDTATYRRPAVMRAGSTCIVDPRHIESGVCFRNMEQQPRGKVFVPVALFSIDHPSILPTLVTYGSDDVQQIAAMTDELLHAKITNVLPDLSNDMTEINLRGTYIG